jgi:hypothetical protein
MISVAAPEVAPAKATGEKNVYLLTRSNFEDYLDFMNTWPVDAATLDKADVADAWRIAHGRMKKLRVIEAKWADNPPVKPVPRELQSYVKRFLDDPVFQNGFGDTPVEVGLVELDRIVVSQKLVSVVHVQRLKEQFGPDPSLEEIVQFCLPIDREPVPHRAGRIGDREFAFISDSNDLRFLEAVMLQPEQIAGYRRIGPIAGVIGLVVGYGSNYLTVIEAEGRLLLHNGNHRACALRDLGITHAPCLIQKLTGREELNAVAPSAVRRNPDFYLKSPRPPVLKDYFDPKLCRVVNMAMTTKEVRVRYSVEQLDMP